MFIWKQSKVTDIDDISPTDIGLGIIKNGGNWINIYNGQTISFKPTIFEEEVGINTPSTVILITQSPKWITEPIKGPLSSHLICLAGEKKQNDIDYCKLKIDDCNDHSVCVLDKKKSKKKISKRIKSKENEHPSENFYKCKCRDLVTKLSKIKGK